MSTNIPFHDQQENWKPISGFDERYWISDRGRVWSNCDFGKILKVHVNHKRNGYLSVNLFHPNGIIYRKYIHLMVIEAFGPPKPSGMECNHKDGVKANCDISNLEWMTHIDNIRHARDIGLFNPCKGDSHHLSKLTEAQRTEVIVLRLLGHTQREIASQFGVSASAVWQIVHRNYEGHGYV